MSKGCVANFLVIFYFMNQTPPGPLINLQIKKIFEIFRFRLDNFDFAQNVLDKLPDKMRRGVVVLRRCGGLVVSVPASRHAGPVFGSRPGTVRSDGRQIVL